MDLVLAPHMKNAEEDCNQKLVENSVCIHFLLISDIFYPTTEKNISDNSEQWFF